MDLMDISDLPCGPDLTAVTTTSACSSSDPLPSSFSRLSPLSSSTTSSVTNCSDININTISPLQPVAVTGRKSEAHKKLNSSSHQTTLLTAAHNFCESQKYVDLHIQCEDGIIQAHQMMLAVASPFLKQLFQMSGTDKVPAGLQDQEPLSLILPEIKISLVQALLHFLYTGNVVTQEGQFYSLMKLVYALNINASIEAESTPESPTLFKTKITTSGPSSSPPPTAPVTCHCGAQVVVNKNAKFDIDSENNLLNSISFNKVTNGLEVNSFTASGVVVKEELDEKPSFLSELSPVTPAPTGSDKTNKTDFVNLLQDTGSTGTSTNNNQLGHFVSVNPGFQIKMEIPGQGTSTTMTSAMTTQTLPTSNSNQSSSVRQVDTSSDDPLAAIMNQTIFGGDGMNTMFIQVNSNSYLSAQNSNIPSINANLVKDGNVLKEETEGGPMTEEGPPAPEDDDLNISYNCETCNKPVKGKVMLQAHKFQEHHENPEFEASSFPEDKFACRVCLKLFTRNSDVKAHILRVHCGDRRYPCTTCGKRFKESTHLRKHLYTHTGERPHFCSLCSKGFQTSSDLKRHKKTRIHQEKVEQAAGDTVAAVTAAHNAANAAAVNDVNMEFNDWTDSSTEDKDLNSNHGTFPATNPRNTSLPFSGTVSLPTEPCPPQPPINTININTNTFTTSSTNFINQNTQPYTNNHSTLSVSDQKPSLWSADEATMSTLMMSPGSLQVQNCSLPSTTLDLSPLDIKWGILDQDPTPPTSISIKQESEKQLSLPNTIQ